MNFNTNIDNSNNNLDTDESRAYNSALMNVYSHILESNDIFYNTQQPINYQPLYIRGRGLNHIIRGIDSQGTDSQGTDSQGIDSHNTNFSRYFSNLSLPFYRPNNHMQNLLITTMNQQNAYKQVLSEKGKTQIQKKTYTENMKNDKCPILLEKFKIGDTVSLLPCNHIFTPSAIEEWLETEQAKCPVCRFELHSKEIKDTCNDDTDDYADDDANDYANDNANDNANDQQNNVVNYTPMQPPSSRDMMSMLESITQMRMLRPPTHINRNRNFVNQYSNYLFDVDNDRAVQEAIMASITAADHSTADHSTADHSTADHSSDTD